jgi:hypothetical protein
MRVAAMSDIEQIRICEEKPELDDGKIRICEEPGEPSDGKIRICGEVEPVDPCPEDLPTLTLTGPGSAEVGSQYQASGGRRPYRYSISAGQIDPATGAITDLSGACGMGSVSVSDNCGHSASVEVRLPSGQWVLSSTEAGPCGLVNPADLACPGYSGQSECSVISGGTKTTYVIVSAQWSACSTSLNCESCVYLHALTINPCYSDTTYDPTCGQNGVISVLRNTDTYAWECP